MSSLLGVLSCCGIDEFWVNPDGLQRESTEYEEVKGAAFFGDGGEQESVFGKGLSEIADWIGRG